MDFTDFIIIKCALKDNETVISAQFCIIVLRIFLRVLFYVNFKGYF